MVAGQSDFEEFDINADLKIDAPPVTPMTTGMEDMLSLGLGGRRSIARKSAGLLPIGGLTPSHINGAPPPEPNYINTDLSGWGPIGKMHPKLLAKDKLVRVYHNRAHDPRYTHLQGYGHQALVGPTGLPPVKPGIGDKIATFDY